ncbi:hypothetical protein [Metabacillus hrfriensis]|uniref:Uncharacterized protein n=1 Tax=Metabacillus hrfriensis TaxID=3048891 RepID=A0ACD4R7J8_9BACI|nr:hypothetical protein [Metabacillus sp. CT-WN-B3]WHZ56433.1 hypothetical protein QLQ22_17245 [Metabacillus sp. CT-WN-B3]
MQLFFLLNLIFYTDCTIVFQGDHLSGAVNKYKVHHKRLGACSEVKETGRKGLGPATGFSTRKDGTEFEKALR